MLTLSTACLIKVLLNSKSNVEGEFYPVGMWFIAICMDCALLALALVLLGG